MKSSKRFISSIRYLALRPLTGLLLGLVSIPVLSAMTRPSLSPSSGLVSSIIKPIISPIANPRALPRPAASRADLPELEWGLHRTNAPDAWKIQRSQRDIIVAVIDTGADTNHPDLRENIWINPGETGIDENGREKATNGIDDDGNSYIDDVHGWNFASQNNDVTDHHGHGTHIAGIIGANRTSPERDRRFDRDGMRVGVRDDIRSRARGIAPGVRLMILKYYETEDIPTNAIAGTIDAIRYAIQMKADIINYSGGGPQPNAVEENAIRQARDAGILFIAAAGNEKSDTDRLPYYPADYDLENILSVTALDPDERILASSNYGARTVDLGAPGKNIYSTMPGGRYGLMTGTSQATAFVTGTAALLMSQRPPFEDPKQLIETLAGTGVSQETLIGKTRFRVRPDAYRALAMQDRGASVSGAIAENSGSLPTVSFAIPKTDNETDLLQTLHTLF